MQNNTSFNQMMGGFSPYGDEPEPHQQVFDYIPFANVEVMSEPLKVWFFFTLAILLFIKAWGNVLAHMGMGKA